MATILIVDDNPIDREVAAGFLREEGHKIRFAEHGADGLQQIREATPDLVLTDLDMPEVNGLELVQKLQEESPLTPVILMTAKGSEEIASIALKSGAASYVPKRTLDSGLVETVRIVLDSARTEQMRQKVFAGMISTESNFELGYDPGGVAAMVDHLRNSLELMNLVREEELTRISTALTEAMINAMDHGNLELKSELLEGDEPSEYHRLREQRIQEEPYKHRRLRVQARINRMEAVFTISDEGPGFDVSEIPDPTDPENLMRPHGRGLLLIRTFIPNVSFNEKGNEIRLRIPKSTETADDS